MPEVLHEKQPGWPAFSIAKESGIDCLLQVLFRKGYAARRNGVVQTPKYILQGCGLKRALARVS